MGITFLKKGKEAHKALQEADAAAEIRAAQRGVRRFWVPKDGEANVTFLDGGLTSDGLLDTTSFNEHRMKINGSWRNYFPCVAQYEPCPLCQMDNNQPSLVSLFTVIDHGKYTDRNGKLHQHERKLFVAKRDTIKRLQKLAAKRGGLTGWQVSISRTGDRSPEVGTDFDFIEKRDPADFVKSLKLKPEDVLPFNYEEVITYYTGDELRKLGFGTSVIGFHDAQKVQQDQAESVTAPKKQKKVKIEKPVVVDDDEDDDDLEATDEDDL
jgi:hypothetical protein